MCYNAKFGMKQKSFLTYCDVYPNEMTSGTRTNVGHVFIFQNDEFRKIMMCTGRHLE